MRREESARIPHRNDDQILSIDSLINKSSKTGINVIKRTVVSTGINKHKPLQFADVLSKMLNFFSFSAKISLLLIGSQV